MKKMQFGALAALLLAACILLGGCNAGAPAGNTVLTVGSERISDAECNYYYVYYLTQNGIDITTQEGVSILNSSTGVEEFATFDDYFRYLVAREIQKTVICLREAENAGWEIPSQQGAQEAQAAMEQMQKECDEAGVRLEDYIHKMWGSGISQQEIRTVFERMYTAKDYYAAVLEPQWIPDEPAIAAWYDNNKDQYDKVDFRCLFLPYEEGDMKANAQLREKAREMLAKVTTEETFINLSAQYAPQDEKEEAKDPDYTSNRNVLKETLNEAPAAWLFAGERRQGDTAMTEDSRGVYVLYFLARRKPEEPLVTVRQLSILSEKTQGGASAAQAKAQELLPQISSESDFSRLVLENSSSDSEKENGGLYQNVYLGGQPQAMEDWCFDKARRPGDKTVLQSEYGSHVLYFVSRTEDAEWHSRCYNKLYSQKMEQAMNALREAYPYRFS